MRQYLIVPILVVLLLFAGCSLPGSGNKPPAEGCPSTNAPVCGNNGQTYTNACLAQSAGVTVAHEGVCTAPNNAACSDGDGGKDIFTAGSVLANGDYSDDSCKDTTAVKEYFCDNGAVSVAELPCPGGYACANGACTVTPCTDTDNGAIAETKGTSSASGTSNTDSCASATKVLEYYCSGGSVLSREMDCGTGKQCTDGACIPITCVDSDNGQTAETFGTTTYGTTSNNDSCADANTVKEYYCEAGQIKNKNIACGTGKSCQSGKCAEVVCTDSDGGQIKDVLGNTTLGATTHQDTCYSETTVIEYFCQSGAIANVKLICDGTKVCLGTVGVCVQPQCTEKKTTLSSSTEIWYSVKSGSSLSIELYEGEMAQLEADGKKYLVQFDSVSENVTTLVLLDNESEDICGSEDVELDTEFDLCEDDVDGATVEVTSVDEETPASATIKGKLAFLEVSTQTGKTTTYTGTGCPENSIDITSETNKFYPRLDSSLEGKSIKLAGLSFEIVDISITEETLTLDIDGDDVEIDGTDPIELIPDVDYDFTVEFNEYGITEIYIEKS